VASFASWSAYAAAGRPDASSAKPDTPSRVRFGASATTSTRHRLPERTTRRIHVRRASTRTAFSVSPATRPSVVGSVAIGLARHDPSRVASTSRRPSIHATRADPSPATASAPSETPGATTSARAVPGRSRAIPSRGTRPFTATR
jgi:hypothetical protein